MNYRKENKELQNLINEILSINSEAELDGDAKNFTEKNLEVHDKETKKDFRENKNGVNIS